MLEIELSWKKTETPQQSKVPPGLDRAISQLFVQGPALTRCGWPPTQWACMLPFLFSLSQTWPAKNAFSHSKCNRYNSPSRHINMPVDMCIQIPKMHAMRCSSIKCMAPFHIYSMKQESRAERLGAG